MGHFRKVSAVLAVVTFVLFVVLDGLLILVYAPLGSFPQGDCGGAYCDYPSGVWVLCVVESAAIALACLVPAVGIGLARRRSRFASAIPTLGIVGVSVLYAGLQVAAHVGSHSP